MIRHWCIAALACFTFGAVSIGCTTPEPEGTGDLADELKGSDGKAHCGGKSKSHGKSKGKGKDKGKCDDGDKKVKVCHIPPGNPAAAHTITVSEAAVPAHLAHGDVLGSCGCDDDDDDGDDDDDDDDGGGSGPSGGGDPVCAADGAACSAGGDCCSGKCGGSGICTSTCNPISDGIGSECSPSMDCCSGAACIQGLCYTGFTCKLEGTACNSDPESGDWCCFGAVCIDDGSGAGTGTCQNWP